MRLGLGTALAYVGAALVAPGVAPAADATQSVSLQPLSHLDLGASLRPRWRGSDEYLTYLGDARVEWAYRLQLPAGVRVMQAQIEDWYTIHLRLSDGRCVDIAPVEQGEELGGDPVAPSDKPCSATAERAQPNGRRLADGQRLIGSTVLRDYTAWTTGRRNETVVRSERTGRDLMKLPMDVSAIGGLPVPDGGGTVLTFFGTHGSEAEILSVWIPPANYPS